MALHCTAQYRVLTTHVDPVEQFLQRKRSTKVQRQNRSTRDKGLGHSAFVHVAQNSEVLVQCSSGRCSDKETAVRSLMMAKRTHAYSICLFFWSLSRRTSSRRLCPYAIWANDIRGSSPGDRSDRAKHLLGGKSPSIYWAIRIRLCGNAGRQLRPSDPCRPTYIIR